MTMTRLAIALAACMAAAPVALAAGDPAAGKPKTAACAACHGPDGNSAAPNFPKLAGQHAGYLLKQMKDIKSGARPVPTMAGMLDPMSEQDLADIAAWYETQTRTPAAAKEDLVALGQSIYRAGVREKGLAACTACHSPTGAGNGPARFPALSGQHAEYIAASLRAYRTEERNNDGDTRIMRDVASRLSDKELEAVASYAAGLR